MRRCYICVMPHDACSCGSLVLEGDDDLTIGAALDVMRREVTDQCLEHGDAEAALDMALADIPFNPEEV